MLKTGNRDFLPHTDTNNDGVYTYSVKKLSHAPPAHGWQDPSCVGLGQYLPFEKDSTGPRIMLRIFRKQKE